MAISLIRTTSATPAEDRRRGQRLGLRWPVQLIRADGAALHTVSENISSSGFFCFIDQQLIPGEELNCYFTIPPEHVSSAKRRVTLVCRSVVSRVIALADRHGVGCRIEEYNLVSD